MLCCTRDDWCLVATSNELRLSTAVDEVSSTSVLQVLHGAERRISEWIMLIIRCNDILSEAELDSGLAFERCAGTGSLNQGSGTIVKTYT